MFRFYDNNGHSFYLISDEKNAGVPLGTAYDDGPISLFIKYKESVQSWLNRQKLK